MTEFQPGDIVLVLAGMNRGREAVFKHYTQRKGKLKAFCKLSPRKLHRVCIEPEKLKLVKRGG